MKKYILISVLAVLLTGNASAQFLWVDIGVNGLTCSQCSRSTELSIKKLDFVQDVVMDLEHTQGKITFKPGAKVSVDKIAKAVEDAGFSLRYLDAEFDFSQISLSAAQCFSFENKQYQFVRSSDKTISNKLLIQFVGKKFLSKKDFKTWESDLVSKCTDRKEQVIFVTVK